MATTYVTFENLTRYDSNMKLYIDSAKTKAIKKVEVVDKTINFYKDAEGTVADFTVDIPVEYFLDQAKTALVQEFAWSDAAYPGSTDPSLEGKPVFVFAVKGDDNTVTYSFLNMESFIDTYAGVETQTVKVTVNEDSEISADVKVSVEEGNILSAKADGLYASVTTVDISGKSDKLVNPEAGEAIIKVDQILVDDGNGNLAASGKTIAELKKEIEDSFVPMTNEEIDALFA